MKRTENTTIGQSLGFPVLLGLAVTLLLLAAGSLLVLGGGVDAAQIPRLALLCLALGCVLAAYLAARRASKNRLIWGLASGAALFACIMGLSILWVGEPISLLRVALNLAVSAAASCIGGMLGAGTTKKRRKR